MRFHSKPIEEHAEVPLADAGRLEAVVDSFSPIHTTTSGVRSYVVSVGVWRSDAHEQAQLSEILGLVEAHGDTVVGQETLRVPLPNPRTYLGSGMCAGVASRARAAGATLLVLDAQLSPSQTRNLEDATDLSVADREIVILGVFQRHARSRLARIQIEIAHLEFLRPRIRGLGLDMDQQAGGIMNGRGAGETASELMARRLDGRLAKLRVDLRKLQRADTQRRRSRGAANRIALVGYTNAGKTSLMNGLTGAGLSTRSRPFETLDTTTRCLTRHGGDVVIGDTVGFIRDLPDRLLPSFSSTLAEVADASLLALVVDLSDPEWRMHVEITQLQLEALGAHLVPRFTVFTKADLVAEVDENELLEVVGSAFSVLCTSDPIAVQALRDRLIEEVRGADSRATVFVPYTATVLSSEIYAGCRVLSSEANDRGVTLEIVGPRSVVGRILRLAQEAS